MRLFGVTGTPMAIRIDANGVIESYGEPARGEDFEELLTHAGQMQEPTQQPAESVRAS